MVDYRLLNGDESGSRIPLSRRQAVEANVRVAENGFDQSSASDSESSLVTLTEGDFWWREDYDPKQKRLRAGSRSTKIFNQSKQTSSFLILRLICLFLFLFFVSLFTELDRSWDPRIYMYGGKFTSKHFAVEMSDTDDTFNTGFVPAITMIKKKRHIDLPSLNLLDYEERSAYPVFAQFPEGIRREDMPQLHFNRSSQVWTRFKQIIHLRGGKIKLEQDLDLRQAMPLQSELSGYIVHNLIYGDDGERIRNNLDKDATWFASHIVLIRTPQLLHSVDGSIIQKGSLIILDGHHTTAVAKLCAQSPHSLLRLGNYNANLQRESVCGKHFSPKQDVLVIENIAPLDVRRIALEAGATTGQNIHYHAHP
mmetsp:Transcript_7241/g.9169  ORF Transcript_7241/g.9169 Transcript_7241/m.9169 type:complete len:366 (-) Transcript_7241:216-1313(-)